MDWLVSDTYEYRSEDFEPGTTGYKFLTLAAHCMRGNVLINTSKGHIGLGSPSAQPGDKVCVLLSCDPPVVLRAVDKNGYLLIGSCYVHDLDDGNDLLGSLPDNLRTVNIFHKDAGGHSRAFLDKGSGKVSFADPRLGRMAVGFAEFCRAVERDPFEGINLSPEVLIEHGVNVEYFDIC
ncbi:hypothetical protein QBC35DRAFT_139921 [Podospora australis]|uniref:Uncharacterized protein n=1 Tax=Podospora australis TaxID=1536484 RepID=A0AAN6WMH4_9PEZI|nr:hypothetical protein QBC35DRAFT_139921 [Podospora australis]